MPSVLRGARDGMLLKTLLFPGKDHEKPYDENNSSGPCKDIEPEMLSPVGLFQFFVHHTVPPFKEIFESLGNLMHTRLLSIAKEKCRFRMAICKQTLQDNG